MIDKLSIIICTYSPEEAVFERCLKAVARLVHPSGLLIEAIIVDNNSPVAVSSLQYVKDILYDSSWMRIIKEEKPGLTNARIAGYLVSKADWIIFFDDDNEPHSSYLHAALTVIEKHPQVGIWGPGVIEVEYMSETTAWFKHNKNRYQQKNIDKEQFSCEKGWQKCYPPGTGQVIRRSVLDAYTQNVATGKLTAKDRTGRNLDSAGDVQIVYTAITINQSIGISPLLVVNHLISARKTTLSYAKRHTFGTTVCYANAHLEFYPDDQPMFALTGTMKLVKDLLPRFKKLAISTTNREDLLIEMSNYLARATGNYRAVKKKEPLLLKFMIRYFALE